MTYKAGFSRREFALLGANLGIASFATLALPARAHAQEAKVMLGHFPSANQQNFSKATGSMQKALGEKTKVEFISVGAGPQILTAMAGDSMDLCNIGSSAMVVGFAQGLLISMVYMHKVIKDSECLVVRNDAGIKELKDLKGKKIGCPFNTSVHFAALSAMKIAGLTAADVTMVNLRPDAILAAWQRKDIDAAYIWHPVLGTLQQDAGTIIFQSGDLIAKGSLIFDGIVCRDACKTQYPDLGLGYVKSQSNFVLVRAGDRTDALVKGALARGIYFRDRSTEPGCAGSLRIATGIVEHTQRAIAVMEEVLCAAQ